MHNSRLHWTSSYFSLCTICHKQNWNKSLIIVNNNGCILIPGFASLLSVSIGIVSPAIGLKSCTITAGIKMYKSVIKKKKKKHVKIILAKTKWNNIEVLISKALTDSYISHDEFVLVNNVLRGNDDMKEQIK